MTAPPASTPGAAETPKPGDEAYLHPANLDYLARMNMALLSELWITRDRLAVLEKLMVNRSLLEANELDQFVPDEEFGKYLEALRSVVVESVVGAPFQNTETVETLMQLGQKLAKLHDRDPE
jgi:hypothetical protein